MVDLKRMRSHPDNKTKQAMQRDCEEAADAIEALYKDAERYRWLRAQDWFSSDFCVLRDPKRVLTDGIGLGADCPSHGRLDAAIDAAMAKP